MHSRLRPTTKQLAMALYESLPFKSRKRLSVLVPLAAPHAADGRFICASETVYLSGMVNEVKVQCEPVSSGYPHGANTSVG